jgi:ribosomal protein L10
MKITAKKEEDGGITPEQLLVVGGVYSDIIFSVNEMKRLKNMPPLSELHGELVATVNAPITTLVGHQLLGALTVNQSKMTRVLTSSTDGLARALGAHEDNLRE